MNSCKCRKLLILGGVSLLLSQQRSECGISNCSMAVSSQINVYWAFTSGHMENSILSTVICNPFQKQNCILNVGFANSPLDGTTSFFQLVLFSHSKTQNSPDLRMCKNKKWCIICFPICQLPVLPPSETYMALIFSFFEKPLYSFHSGCTNVLSHH